MKIINILLISFLFSFSLMANEPLEITEKEFKEYLKEPNSEGIPKGMEDYPLYKKSSVFIKFTRPNKQSFQGFAKGSARYIKNKYLLTELNVNDVVKMYSLLFWNDSIKKYEQWTLAPDGRIGKIVGRKDANMIFWKGKTPSGTNYEGKVVIGKENIVFNGKETDDSGNLVFIEEGKALPTE